MRSRIVLLNAVSAIALAVSSAACFGQTAPLIKGTFEEKLQIAAKSGIESVELVAEHVNWTDAEIREHIPPQELVQLLFLRRQPISQIDSFVFRLR